MTDTWSDPDLDAALAELAVTLDPGGDDAALARARARWTTGGAASATAGAGDLVADVLELGDDEAGHRPRATRWTTGLLLAAAVVAALVLGAVFWPGTSDRATPLRPGPSTPTATSSPLSLLPEPLPPVGRSYTVITSTSGVGDAVVPFTPLTSALDLAGNPVTLTYNFVCGLPDVPAADRPQPSPSDEPATAVDASITDNRGGAGGTSACSGLADGHRALDSSSYGSTDPVGRSEVRIDVQDPTTVWKLTVTAASG